MEEYSQIKWLFIVFRYFHFYHGIVQIMTLYHTYRTTTKHSSRYAWDGGRPCRSLRVVNPAEFLDLAPDAVSEKIFPV